MRLWFLFVLVAAVSTSSACSNVDAKLTCTSDDDCFEHYACDLVQTNVCLRSCEGGDDCLDSQFCDIEAGETSGVCRHGVAAAAGDPSGDPAGDPSGDPAGDPSGDPAGDPSGD